MRLSSITLLIVCLLLLGGRVACAEPKAAVCKMGSEKRSALFRKVSQGSFISLRLVEDGLSCLDGGDLEDAHVSIGEGLFRPSVGFVPRLTSKQVTEYDLISIATMLPARFVDEPCLQRIELMRRKGLLSRRSEFQSLRTVMLPALQESIEDEVVKCSRK